MVAEELKTYWVLCLVEASEIPLNWSKVVWSLMLLMTWEQYFLLTAISDPIFCLKVCFFHHRFLAFPFIFKIIALKCDLSWLMRLGAPKVLSQPYWTYKVRGEEIIRINFRNKMYLFPMWLSLIFQYYHSE